MLPDNGNLTVCYHGRPCEKWDKLYNHMLPDPFQVAIQMSHLTSYSVQVVDTLLT